MATLVKVSAQVYRTTDCSPFVMWHLLSLDAPAVAALWTAFLARVLSVHQGATVPLALALAVWMLYTADRVSDALRGGILHARHHFHYQHRRRLGVLLLIAAPVLGILVGDLPDALRSAWLLLSLPLLLYVVAVHGWQWRHLPKELVVGLLFGVASAVPVIVDRSAGWHSLLITTLLFCALACFNGIAITRWEAGPGRAAGACISLLVHRFDAAGLSLALASAACLVHRQSRPVALAVLLSTSLLLLLERLRFDRVHQRALADAALLTPLAIWPMLPLLMGK